MAVDWENDLLLITGASGKQSGALLQHLAPRWKRLRLQCVSDASAANLRAQYPAAEVVQSSFRELADARKLLRGVSACYLLSPGFHPRETHNALNIIDAAAEAVHSGGPFQHMVYSSVLHPILTAMVNHDSKRHVEEALLLSSLSFTIVQPSHIMDNVPIQAIAAQERPVFPARFNPRTKFSFTALFDLGEAVAKIFSEREKHFFATYELVSTPRPLDYVEAMDIVSAEIGRTVEIKQISHEQAVSEYVSTLRTGTDAEKQAIRSGQLRMFSFYDSTGLVGNPSVLKMLLGREPLSYRDWVRMRINER